MNLVPVNKPVATGSTFVYAEPETKGRRSIMDEPGDPEVFSLVREQLIKPLSPAEFAELVENEAKL